MPFILSASFHCAAGNTRLQLWKTSSPLCWNFIHVSTIFVNPNTEFWQLLLYFSVNCSHLTLNYFFKKEFKKTPQSLLNVQVKLCVAWEFDSRYFRWLDFYAEVDVLDQYCPGVADGPSPSPVAPEPHPKPEPAVLTAGESWWHTVYAQQQHVLRSPWNEAGIAVNT